LSGGPSDFDLDAAWLRRWGGDLRAFMEALAVRMEGALPGRVEVERRRDGLFSKTSHVRRIAVRGETAIHELVLNNGALTATRRKLVRGVVISSADQSLPDWLREVGEEVSGLARDAAAADAALHDFL
jgi:hypothetical protein